MLDKTGELAGISGFFWGADSFKPHEYRSLSPYNFVANNPISMLDPDGRYIQAVNTGTMSDFTSAVSSQFGSAFARGIVRIERNRNGVTGRMSAQVRFENRDDFNDWASDNGVGNDQLDDAWGVYQALSGEEQIGLGGIEVSESFTYGGGAEGTAIGKTGLKNVHSDNEGYNNMLGDIAENGEVDGEMERSIFTDNDYNGERLGDNELFFKQNMNERNPIDGVTRKGVLIYNSNSNRSASDVYKSIIEGLNQVIDEQ